MCLGEMASTSAVKLDHVPLGSSGSASPANTAFAIAADSNAASNAISNAIERAEGTVEEEDDGAMKEQDAEIVTASAAEERPVPAPAGESQVPREAFASDGANPATLPKPGTAEEAVLQAFLQPEHVAGLQDAVGTFTQQAVIEDDGPISAYAKLEFPGFSYYIQTLDVLIGRRPGNAAAGTTPPLEDGGPSGIKQITGTRQEGHVDVDLGPMKSISRHHARIFYNPPSMMTPGDLSAYRGQMLPGEGTFVLEVLGRNGAFVDDVYCDRGSCVPLSKR